MKKTDRFFSAVRRFTLGMTILMAAGCAFFPKPPAKPSAALVRLAVQDYPDFSDGLFLDNLSYGIGKSLEYLNRVPAERTFRFGEDAYSALHLIRSLETLRDFVETRPGRQRSTVLLPTDTGCINQAGGRRAGRCFLPATMNPTSREA